MIALLVVDYAMAKRFAMVMFRLQLRIDELEQRRKDLE